MKRCVLYKNFARFPCGGKPIESSQSMLDVLATTIGFDHRM